MSAAAKRVDVFRLLVAVAGLVAYLAPLAVIAVSLLMIAW